MLAFQMKGVELFCAIPFYWLDFEKWLHCLVSGAHYSFRARFESRDDAIFPMVFKHKYILLTSLQF